MRGCTVVVVVVGVVVVFVVVVVGIWGIKFDGRVVVGMGMFMWMV